MKIIQIKNLEPKEIKVLRFARFADNRGYFTEPFRFSQFIQEFIPDFKIVQINESFSKKGVIRGLHFQWNPYMGKLVRTIKGYMIDLFLDIRKKSPTYGKISAYEMPSDFDKDYSEWIWVPPGFAHGNIFLEDTVIEYLCTGEYSPGCEAGINPLDKDLDWSFCPNQTKEKIKKMIKRGLIISEKDKKGLSLKQWGSDEKSNNFIYGRV
ncbi:MAG: dTDP-4-dehydrorhamnose 3,5-epimerase family protein [Microgenomates group bacterium]|nr:dTDP-4-dehydrorhamnose 3,5-epimerase family protein [Microgenomates group bacterium]